MAVHVRSKPFPHVTCASMLTLAMLVLFFHESLIGMLTSEDVLAAPSALEDVSDGVLRDYGLKEPPESSGRPPEGTFARSKIKEKTKSPAKKRDMSEEEKEEWRAKRCKKWRAAASKGDVEAFEGEFDDTAAAAAAATDAIATGAEDSEKRKTAKTDGESKKKDKKQKFTLTKKKEYCHSKSGMEKACYTAVESKTNRKNVRPHRGVHTGHRAVLFCTGPTMDAFKLVGVDEHGRDANGKKVILVGVNTIILRDDVKMDYVFVQDRGAKTGDTGYLANKPEFDAYVPGIAKFFGHFTGQGWTTFGPSSEHTKDANATRYELGKRPLCNQVATPMVSDIGEYAFGGSCSTIFSAMQFVLYTGIEQLFIVGCDVSASGGGYSASAKKADGKGKGGSLLYLCVCVCHVCVYRYTMFSLSLVCRSSPALFKN